MFPSSVCRPFSLADMALPPTMFLILFSIVIVSGHLYPTDMTNIMQTMPEAIEEEKALWRNRDRQQRSVGSPQDNPECQEGKPLGAIYSGEVNVTMSGRTCKAWSATEYGFNDVGEHNYCRNPSLSVLAGVWCFTTDPNMLWEFCSVPFCSPTYDCQEGEPLGVTYAGSMSVTQSGRTCKSWSAAGQAWEGVGDHNHCRNPSGAGGRGVWCYTTDTEKPWEYCNVPICPLLEVLDFSADNDQAPDSNGEFTSASLVAGPLPESLTVCFAFMIEAWTTEFSSAALLTLPDKNGHHWGSINLFAASSYTEYRVQFGPVSIVKNIEGIFFPLQWTNVCLSVDLVARRLTLVVDGQVLGEEEYKREEDDNRPQDLSLTLGYSYGKAEYTGRVSEVNIFNSSLSSERMKELTTAGGEECGAPGDLVNWEEAEWTLYSQAKVIGVDREWEGPCRRESQVNVFAAEFEYHHDCMQHCQKIAGGQSPPVTTKEQWENMTREVDLITRDHSSLPWIWLSATEGDIDQKLATLQHWPETEFVNNETEKLEAEETIWRDFYTGQRLGNWTKPYLLIKKDMMFGETHNCMMAVTSYQWEFSWDEWQCHSMPRSCTCSYPAQPLLRLRGLCSSSLIYNLFSPKQLPGNPSNMILLGLVSTRIEYNDKTSRWNLTDARYEVSAVSQATKLSYLLGKHNWTISNDAYECSEGQAYNTTLKLSGCKEDEFTCDDGQCVKMERRCDQVTGEEPNCRDESDENGCQLVVLKNNYNKNIPPIGSAKDGTVIPVDVSISITLMKVVEIEEVDHSIHLQFQISLSWKENRVKYQNLKKETSLNTLTEENIETIWLPLIVYDNTDQKEVTRLGMDWEWATIVTVTRNLTNNFTRSGLDQVDEAEIFDGDKHKLTMEQMYTWEFQCQYQLQRYPFDTQVQCA